MKNSYFIKASFAALASLVAGGMMFSGNVMAAEEVKDTKFQDQVFREYVMTNFDKDGNGVLSEEELGDVKEIDVSGLDIKSLSGIKHFTRLIKLNCSNTKVESINLNDNASLLTIDCSNCKLNNINISDCYVLEDLDCSNNCLEEFAFSNGFLEKLNISGNKNLKTLNVSKNALSSLNVEGCAAITDIDISDNKMESVDLSSCTKLTKLNAEKNALKSLDVTKTVKLEELNVQDNKLTSVALGTNSKLTRILSNDNSLKEIDISGIKNLNELQLNRNALKAIDLSGCKGISILDVDDNKIRSIDISNNPTLLQTYLLGKTKDVEGTITYVLSEDGVEGRLTFDPEVKIVTKGSLTLDKMSLTLKAGETDTLKATLKGADGKITWKSSDKKIATVNSEGKITAKMAGKATITVTAAGKTAICKVTVLFKDVTDKKDFWYNPTYELNAKGVVKGYADQTEFRPANECSRAQMVTFLWRLAGSPEPTKKETSFKDVKSTDYFFKPVIWAVEKGITTGVSKTKFAPSGICTRAQTVTFLWRMAGKPAPKADKCKFTDVKSGDYFYKATIWASEKKIVAGYSDNTFKPSGKCLRRQMVTFLYKYDKNV